MTAVPASLTVDELADTRGASDGSGGPALITSGRTRLQQIEDARAMALRSLEASAKTRAQLGQRLRRGGVADDVACDVLDRFEAVGLVDDAAFAREWVRLRHASRGLARRALRQELTTKGIDPELIDSALSQISADDEQVAARRLADRSLLRMPGLDRVTIERRLAGRLGRRGYSAETVRVVVAERLG